MVNTRRFSPFLCLGAALALAMWLAAPALAHHKDGHDEGGGKAESSSETTEDNDDDGQPNTPDQFGDSDNRHPSGKDKHAEAGNSGNQGNSSSDPDDDGHGPDRSNGGPDKPGGSGGVDKEDQDGNNGCGNDDDFEDDNEGWCGGKPKPSKEEGAAEGEVPGAEKEEEVPGAEKEEEPEAEADDEPEAEAGGKVMAAGVQAPQGQVESAEKARQPSGAVLPFTGNAALAPFVAAGLVLIGAGTLLIARRH
jgi:hypothetical protein